MAIILGVVKNSALLIFLGEALHTIWPGINTDVLRDDFTFVFSARNKTTKVSNCHIFMCVDFCLC